MWPRSFSKTTRALFLRPSQNFTVTACENDAAPFSKTMRALFVEAISEFCGDGVAKRCCPLFERQCANCFLRLFQHLTSKTRQADYAIEFERKARDF
jgi:hypothetical protein